jgi:hypothetical protein
LKFHPSRAGFLAEVAAALSYRTTLEFLLPDPPQEDSENPGTTANYSIPINSLGVQTKNLEKPP